MRILNSDVSQEQLDSVLTSIVQDFKELIESEMKHQTLFGGAGMVARKAYFRAALVVETSGVEMIKERLSYDIDDLRWCEHCGNKKANCGCLCECDTCGKLTHLCGGCDAKI